MATSGQCGTNKSLQRQSPESGIHGSLLNKDGITQTVKSRGELRQTQSVDAQVPASHSCQDQSTGSTTMEKAPDNLLEKESPDSMDHISQSNPEGTSAFATPDTTMGGPQQVQNPEANPSEHNQQEAALPEKGSLQPALKYDGGVHTLQSEQVSRTPSRMPDKASEDGYNWRKYGQKLVKGNEFIRSYYRCTHPGCLAKRQVKRSQEGQITDTIYLGQHEHPKHQMSPQVTMVSVLPIQGIRADRAPLIKKDKLAEARGHTSHTVRLEIPQVTSMASSNSVSEGILSQSSRTRDEVDIHSNPNSKRRKRDVCDVDETPVEREEQKKGSPMYYESESVRDEFPKTNGEPRVIVKTQSEVDIVNDGYRWRKYGQKLVKGNQHPRSYYRCSHAGCLVKKHVERASHDPKVVTTTYEGQHDHDMPLGRTVTPNIAGSNLTTLNGDSTSGPEEKAIVLAGT